MTTESIAAKYARLLEAIKRLEAVHNNYDLPTFLADPQAQDATLYNLVIGIEAICDIGNHILAERFQDYAEKYADVLRKLGDHGVVPKSLVKSTLHMAGFRNLAIHVYEGLSLERVYELLEHAPDDFRAYAKALAQQVDE